MHACLAAQAFRHVVLPGGVTRSTGRLRPLAVAPRAVRAGVRNNGGRAVFSAHGRENVMNQMVHTERYELIFQMSGAADDVVSVRLTDRLGAGGFPVYEDETGIVRAEISDRGEVRMIASGGHQVPGAPLLARPLSENAPGTR